MPVMLREPDRLELDVDARQFLADGDREPLRFGGIGVPG